MGAVRMRALGGFEVFVDGRPATPSAPKPRQILAVLALRRGESVTVDALIDELWGDRPPRGAVAALQTHIYELRKDLRAAHADQVLVTRRNAYAVDMAARFLDVTRFDGHLAAGAAALLRDDPTVARRHLVGALRLSGGRPLANVRCGDFLTGQVVRLQEARLRANELKIEADLRLGRHDEVIGELRVAVSDHPFHEGLVLKLMTALSARGRRGEALAAYRALRARLADELNVGPTEELQQLHDTLVSAGGTSAAATVPSPAAQLPGDLASFTGRDTPLAQATAHVLERSRRRASPVVTITGLPGTGKTATAVHVAYALREHFPDGQFFVDGAGTGSPGGGAALAQRLLHACAPGKVAGNPVSAFRAWCAQRRALIIVDDLADLADVPLVFPKGTGCAAVLTSWSARQLPGALPITLLPMDNDEGVALLARLVPDRRVDAEPAAAKGLVDAVDGLPLALRHVAQWMAGTPGRRVDTFLTTLVDALDRQPLSQLPVIGPGVYAGLYDTYLRLPAAEQHTFRLLCLLPTGDFTTDDAAKAFLRDPIATELALLRLADAHLVRPLGDARWAVPSLLRRLARECLTQLSHGGGRVRAATKGAAPAPTSAPRRHAPGARPPDPEMMPYAPGE